MKITRIAAWQVDLPLHEGSYKWSGGKSVDVFDSTVVRIETDTGLVGHGEVCPLGPFYLAAYASGVRAGIAELGPHLVTDPGQLAPVDQQARGIALWHRLRFAKFLLKFQVPSALAKKRKESDV